MSAALTFVIGTLAVWRASLLITEDEGPFGVFLALRERFDPHQKTWVGRGLACVWCVSWWAGLVTAIWLWYFAEVPAFMVPIWWFGLSGGAIALQNMATRRR